MIYDKILQLWPLAILAIIWLIIRFIKLDEEVIHKYLSDIPQTPPAQYPWDDVSWDADGVSHDHYLKKGEGPDHVMRGSFIDDMGDGTYARIVAENPEPISKMVIVRRRWSDADENHLLLLALDDIDTDVIAEELGRTPSAVYNKAAELGISLKQGLLHEEAKDCEAVDDSSIEVKLHEKHSEKLSDKEGKKRKRNLSMRKMWS